MKSIALDAETRELGNKQVLKTLRKDGKIPSVFYGHNEKTIHITVNEKKFEKVVEEGRGANIMLDIKIGDKINKALIKEIYRDMISQKLMHIDFQAISMKEKVEINVHLHIVGESPGVKLHGGILERVTRDIHVKCLPSDIPADIKVDVSSLDINHSVCVKDLPKIQGVDVMTDPSTIIVNIVSPTVLEEKPAEEGLAAEGVGATPAEPEVISKGKKDKEGEEAEGSTEKK